MNKALIILVSTSFLAGCSTLGDVTSFSNVQPWERDVLARDDMQFVSDPMESTVDDHLYFSKEGSTGGNGIQGGGCGCN